MAGRASVQLHTLIFFKGDGAKEEDAYVLDVETAESSTPSFTVMVPRYGIEGRVRLSVDPGDPKLLRFPNEHKISYEFVGGSPVSIQVFDKVRIRIWVRETQDHRRELVLDLVKPHISAVVETCARGKRGHMSTNTTTEDSPERNESPKKKKKSKKS